MQLRPSIRAPARYEADEGASRHDEEMHMLVASRRRAAVVPGVNARLPKAQRPIFAPPYVDFDPSLPPSAFPSLDSPRPRLEASDVRRKTRVLVNANPTLNRPPLTSLPSVVSESDNSHAWTNSDHATLDLTAEQNNTEAVCLEAEFEMESEGNKEGEMEVGTPHHVPGWMMEMMSDEEEEQDEGMNEDDEENEEEQLMENSDRDDLSHVSYLLLCGQFCMLRLIIWGKRHICLSSLSVSTYPYNWK